MASKKTLNAENLAALGAERLAELLMEVSAGNAAAKRHLRLALAGALSPTELAHEVRKRLAVIARSHTLVTWEKRGTLVADLETQRRAIVEQVAKADPAAALDLLWRFMALADPVFARCDDSSGTVIGIFRSACADLGTVATAAKGDPRTVADHAFQALVDNNYGQFDGLIVMLAPALGQEGLEHLKRRMIDLSNRPVRRPPDHERVAVGWGSMGTIYADEIKERSRLSTVRLALKDIADLQGDVDAFIAQYDERARKVPKIAAEIARRLLTAGRTDEAWRAIETAEHRRGGWPDFAWEDARIEVLDALGRGEEAQETRWSCFERALSGPHLRAHLKRLPDFDDLAAEERALDHAKAYPSLLQALVFLVDWPALERAAALVTQRAAELNGDHYELLTPAAERLAEKYPLAATLVLRAMIDFSLTRNRSSRYRHAARHLMECASLAAQVADFGRFERHEAYVARLRREHGKKSSFWSVVS